MSLSALDLIMRECAADLEQMKRARLSPEAQLTLVVRLPGVDGAHFVVSTDDLDEVIQLLRKENG